MKFNHIIFDIETVPDVESYRRLSGVGPDIDDSSLAEMMFAERYAESGKSFLKHPMHKIACISAVVRKGDRLFVGSFGFAGGNIPDEAQMLEKFFSTIDTDKPILVSWNGSGFDLPVMHYRALMHGIVGKFYWDNGGINSSNRDAKLDNYHSRYLEKHTDLMDVLSGYSSGAGQKLDMVASLLGFPGKLGMDGSNVWDAVKSGRLIDVVNYCEHDVLNTYLCFLKWELIRGNITPDEHSQEEIKLKELLRASHKNGKYHLSDYLMAWEGQQ